jgi:hypothetical protein
MSPKITDREFLAQLREEDNPVFATANPDEQILIMDAHFQDQLDFIRWEEALYDASFELDHLDYEEVE